MATTVNWITGEITIPRADMPIVQASPEVRSLDTAAFFDDLKDLEASAEGMPWPDTQRHNLSYTISGVQYAESLEIIAPYFVTFEDGQYRVSLSGTNNNIIDVATANQVGILGNNSAGLIYNAQQSIGQADLDNIADAVWDETLSGHVTAGTAGKALGDVDTNVTALPSAADNADAVWDETADAHLTAGTTGLRLREIKDDTSILRADVATNTSLIGQVADDVWDVPIASHTDPGTTGEALSDIDGATSTAPSASEIADAVWDEPISGHTTSGTFGEWVQKKLLTVAKFIGLSG